LFPFGGKKDVSYFVLKVTPLSYLLQFEFMSFIILTLWVEFVNLEHGRSAGKQRRAEEEG